MFRSLIHSSLSLQQSPPRRSTCTLILSISPSHAILPPSPTLSLAVASSFASSPLSSRYFEPSHLSLFLPSLCLLLLFPLIRLPSLLIVPGADDLKLCRSWDSNWKQWIPGLPAGLSKVDSWQEISVREAARTASYLLRGLEDCAYIGRTLWDRARKPLGCFVLCENLP